MRNIIYGTIGLASVLALGAYIFTSQQSTTSSFSPDTSTAQVQPVQNTDTVTKTEEEAVTLSVTAEHYAVSDTFSDIEDSAWYTKYVQRAFEEGLVEGNPNGTFEADAPLTFGAFSVMLSNSYHGTELTDNKYIFAEETQADWSTAYIQTLKILYGTSPEHSGILDTLNGDTQLTRFNASSLVGMLLTSEGLATQDYASNTGIFTDLGNLDTTQTNLLGVAQQFNVMSGTTDSTFEGETILTRAEACVILCALLDLSEGNQLPRDTYTPETQPSQSAIQKLEEQKQAEAAAKAEAEQQAQAEAAAKAEAEAQAEAEAEQQAQSKPSTPSTSTPSTSTPSTSTQTPAPTPAPEPTPEPSTPSTSIFPGRGQASAEDVDAWGSDGTGGASSADTNTWS